MISIFEGAKRLVGFKVIRRTGSGAIALTAPERRILNAQRALVAGFDWAAASWNDQTAEILTLFDSTAAGLTAVGSYYVQLRGVIGSERYQEELTVQVKDWGP